MVRVSPVNRIRLPAIAVSGGSGPALTVNPFSAITGAPLVGTEWSTGENRVVHDATTGDLLWFVGYQDADFRVYSSQDKGDTWSLLTTITTGGGFNYPNRIFGACPDSMGAVHCLSIEDDGGARPSYLRFGLTRSGGHVTAASITQTPFALPDRDHGAPDWRGDICMVRRSGAERPAWVYGCPTATDGNNWTAYAGVGTTLTPASVSDFTGLDGTGNDEAVYGYNGDGFGTWHLSVILISQNATTEDIYFGIGRVNGDHRSIEGLDADQNTKYKRYIASGGNWSAGSTTTVATGDGSVCPMILDMQGGTNCVGMMYLDPNTGAGVRVARILADGSLETVTRIAAADGRAAFGAMGMSLDGTKFWVIWHTYWLPSDQQRQGGYANWNGSSWNITNEASPQDCNGIATTAGWFDGVCAVRWTGALLPQSMSAVHIASIYGT